MAKKWRYITVEEDRQYREIAKQHGIYYTTPTCLFLRDAPEESDAFEHMPNYDRWTETFLAKDSSGKP